MLFAERNQKFNRHNLLQAARFAFRMQQAERHNSIED